MGKNSNFEEFMREAEKLDPEGFAKARADRAELDSLRKDAERYRKLRRGQHWSVINGIGDELRGEALDSAVDAVTPNA